MPYDNDNIFAKLLRGEILTKKIYEDEYALAFPDINPQAPVHILLIPKGKYVSASDFGANASPQEIAGYYRALSVVVKMMQIEESGYRVICNSGPDSHQLVPHFHAHILGGRKMGHILVETE